LAAVGSVFLLTGLFTPISVYFNLAILAAVGSVFLLTGLFTPISVYFNLVMGSSVPLLPSQFPPRPSELSVTQMSVSTNQTCTLTPSLIEVEGTPQQIEGPYFVDVIPF
jgi:hypothetical protein